MIGNSYLLSLRLTLICYLVISNTTEEGDTVMAPTTSGRPFPRRARGTQSPGMAHSERYNTLNKGGSTPLNTKNQHQKKKTEYKLQCVWKILKDI